MDPQPRPESSGNRSKQGAAAPQQPLPIRIAWRHLTILVGRPPDGGDRAWQARSRRMPRGKWPSGDIPPADCRMGQAALKETSSHGTGSPHGKAATGSNLPAWLSGNKAHSCTFLHERGPERPRMALRTDFCSRTAQHLCAGERGDAAALARGGLPFLCESKATSHE